MSVLKIEAWTNGKKLCRCMNVWLLCTARETKHPTQAVYDSPVRGQSAFTAIPSALSSSAMPSTHIDMPYLAMVYAVMRRREKGEREEEEREDKGGGVPEINPC